jgi:hypothetical protein
MRTTVRIDEHLLREAKRAAAERGTTLTAIIEDALREALARRGATSSAERFGFELPTFGRGSRLQPSVDLDDSAALLDLMEQDDPPV